MKKYFFVLAAAALLLAAQPLYAEIYHSKTLDYTVNLPAGWEVLNYEKLQSNPNILSEASDSAYKGAWKGTDRSLTENVSNMLKSGNVEYLVNSKRPGSVITVNQASGQIPQNDAEVLKMCQSLPGELSQASGRQMRVYSCEAASIAGSTGVYLVADAYSEGARSLQYEVQKSPNQMLVFTATCKEQGCAQVQKEFSSIVNSVRFK